MLGLFENEVPSPRYPGHPVAARTEDADGKPGAFGYVHALPQLGTRRRRRRVRSPELRPFNGLNSGLQNNDVAGVCPSSGDACTYPNAPGFSVCILSPGGDMPCPDGWPTRHLIFEQAEQCGCTCGSAAGESCSATVTAYKDIACSTPLGSVVATLNQPAMCLDVASGSPLGSKSAMVSYQPGTCTATLTPTQPSTLCCLP